jgi:hypothetical protein
MKLYCVFGIEWHIGRELLGVYDSMELANERKAGAELTRDDDDVVIDEIELNSNVNTKWGK